MLSVEGLNASYGDVQVLWDVSFDVKEGEIIVIVGSNGAGKTTTLRVLAGLMYPKFGAIIFSGEDIAKIPPHERVKKGIALIPEGRMLFTRLTVEENLRLGAITPKAREARDETLKWVYELFPILKERKRQIAGTLSGGEQQMLAIARGLMSQPKLLMLDEPSLGLAPKIVAQVFELLMEINKQGITILLVEQNVWRALEIADRGYVMETGRIVLSGSGEHLLNNEYVKKSYLGI
ncbi:MAG: ABC transporter ATP-binding protein [Candidatus Bathyarchaeia archaeon]